MKKPFHVLPVLAAAIMLFAFGCASADITDGLVYDEADNTWTAADEDLTELVSIMKRECTKSSLIKGAYTKVFRSAPLTPNWSWPTLEMYDADGAHASHAGSDFAAKLIWETILDDLHRKEMDGNA